jgi:hypothetical protein
LVVAAWLAGCAAPRVPAPVVASAPMARETPRPDWRPGDRWVYEWTSGTDSGSKTVTMLDTREVNTVRYYVLRVDDVDHYYTANLEWAAAVRAAKVEARISPPQPWFVWPLEAGRRWTHQAAYEDPNGRQLHNDRFGVVGAEVVEVPAGRFQALKLVRETDHRDFDEYWYAPEVRWYARWIGGRGDVRFEERLREYSPAPRLIPAPAAPPAPSKTD